MKHYHVEAFDERGFDVLPPRTILIIEASGIGSPTLNTSASSEVAKVVTSRVSYCVITELASV